MPVLRFASALPVLICGSLAFAAPVADRPPATPPAEKITITSQSLVFKNQENIAVFDGKVVMSKVNFIMHADHMIVHFEGAGESAQKPAPKNESPAPRPAGPELPTLGNRAVSLIEAMGNVRLEQSGKTATSKKAVYAQRDEKLVLTGDPQVWEKGYHIIGVRMTMFLKEDRSIVEDSRVIINDTDTVPQ
jgi:lipopolysaccharide export system protein LptA